MSSSGERVKVSAGAAMGARGAAVLAVAALISAAAVALFAFSLTVLDSPGCDARRYSTNELYEDNTQWRRWWASYNKARGCEGAFIYGAGSGGLTPLEELEEDCSLQEPPRGGECDACADTGYGGAGGYAARFNRCMKEMPRLRECVPQVDDDGTLVSHHYSDETFNYIVANDGTTLLPYIDREDFLAACEARVGYADQRDNFGWALQATMAVPAVVWLLVTLHMACSWRGKFEKELAHTLARNETPSVELATIPGSGSVNHEGSAWASDKGQTPEAALEGGEAAPEMKDGAPAASGGDVERARKIVAGVAPQPPGKSGVAKCSEKWHNVKNNPWVSLALLVFAETLELGPQFFAFRNPVARNILEPIAHGSLIAASAFLMPVLFILDKKDGFRFVNGLVSLGYWALGLQGMLEIFLDAKDPSGMVSFEKVEGAALFLRCVSSALPLVSFALVANGAWSTAVEENADRTFELATGKPVRADNGADVPKAVRALQFAYAACSWTVGLLALLAVVGVWDCGVFRTCQVPPCSVAEDQLPFGIPASSLPFETSEDYSNLNFAMRLRSASMREDGPEDQRLAEWNWQQRSNVRFGVKLEEEDGGYVFTLTVSSDNGQIDRRVTSQTGVSAQVRNKHQQGSYGKCAARFSLECQEASTSQSFRDQLDSYEFVEFRTDNTVKLVLMDPKPDCWTAPVSEAASAWWYDHMLFGPSIIAGTDADGTPKQGLVMRTTECTDAVMQMPADDMRCFVPAQDVIHFPGLGRNPIEWSDWELDGDSTAMPTAWTASGATGDFSMTLAIESTEIESGGAGGEPGGGGGGGNNGNNGGGSNCVGDVSVCVPKTDRSSCETTANPQGGMCQWNDPQPGGGGNCIGDVTACGPHMDRSSCEATANPQGGMCQWNDMQPNNGGNCLGDAGACSPKTDQATCEATANPRGGMCEWSAGPPPGSPCIGEIGCETNADSAACNADSRNCEWKACGGDPGCELNNDQTTCTNDSRNCSWEP